MERLLGTSGRWEMVPAAFFMHFGPDHSSGRAGITKHMDYFRATGMDFLKIQYEKTFPLMPDIVRPEDWKRMPVYGLDFYEEPLRLLEGLVAEAKHEALVIQTLYSPYMSAGHSTSDQIVQAHLNEDPEAVRIGLESIAESMLLFVKECVRLGADGFYMSTQGAESERYAKPGVFETFVKPYDLVLMEEAARTCPLTILHVCDYHRPYSSLDVFKDYPGSVVNFPCRMADGSPTSPAAIYAKFDRPVMGGLDKKGPLSGGDPEAIRRDVTAALESRPPRFILGADCTVSGTIPWEHVKLAIDLAHDI